MLYLVIKMQKTKLAIVMVVAVALSIATLGVAYAQYSTAPTNPNTQYPDNGGFWGWMGRCLRGYNPYNNYPYQQPTTPYPTNTPQTTIPPQTITPPAYTQQYPNQGYTQYGYERGCWGW
jgi:hypothetical protein